MIKERRRKQQKYRILDLFAGIGGFSYAAYQLGMVKSAVFVEKDEFCQKILRKNFRGLIYNDITTFVPFPREFDIITFGSPCQDLSQAGKKAGIKGDRSGLFYDAVRILKQCQPRGFIMENVIGIRKWVREVLEEFQEIRTYNLYWYSVSVAELGGCHKRERWFCIGWEKDQSQKITNSNKNAKAQAKTSDSVGERRKTVIHKDKKRWRQQELFSGGCDSVPSESAANAQSRRESRSQSRDAQEGSDQTFGSCSQREKQEIKSRVCGENDGFSRRMDGNLNKLFDLLLSPEEAHHCIQERTASDALKIENRSKRLKALGNAVTPAQAAIALTILDQLLSS